MRFSLAKTGKTRYLGLMLKVQKKRCNECLFGDNFVVSCEERRDEVIRDALAKDSYFVCHKSSISNKKKDEDVCCRGYWDAHKDDFNLGRIAQRLGGPYFMTVK
jgi:hypothetical protein